MNILPSLPMTIRYRAGIVGVALIVTGLVVFFMATDADNAAKGSPEIFLQTGHSVDAVAWCPDGEVLATGSGEVKLWDVATGRLLRTISRRGRYTDIGVSSVTWSSDGMLPQVAFTGMWTSGNQTAGS